MENTCVYQVVRTPHGRINVKKECCFSPVTSFSYIWLTSFQIFNNISKEGFNSICSLMLLSSFPFPSLNKAGGRGSLGCSLSDSLTSWSNTPKDQPVLCTNSHVAGEQDARCPLYIWVSLLDCTLRAWIWSGGERALPCTPKATTATSEDQLPSPDYLDSGEGMFLWGYPRLLRLFLMSPSKGMSAPLSVICYLTLPFQTNSEGSIPSTDTHTCPGHGGPLLVVKRMGFLDSGFQGAFEFHLPVKWNKGRGWGRKLT